MSRPPQTDPPLHQGPPRQAGVVELVSVVGVVIVWLWVLADEVSVKAKTDNHTSSQSHGSASLALGCSFNDRMLHKEELKEDLANHGKK